MDNVQKVLGQTYVSIRPTTERTLMSHLANAWHDLNEEIWATCPDGLLSEYGRACELDEELAVVIGKVIKGMLHNYQQENPKDRENKCKCDYCYKPEKEN
jgi:hypothetical protein